MVGALGWDIYEEYMLMSDLDDVGRAFREAAEAFTEILSRPEVERAWAEPSALEGYTVGAIVTHVNGAIGWTLRLLELPAPVDVRPMPRAEVLALLNSLKIGPDGADRHPIHDVLRDQFEEAARKGWEATRAKFLGLTERLAERLEGESGGRVVDLRPTAPLVLRIGDWMPTRVVELVVHGDDLATSVGIDPPRLSDAAATVTIYLLMATARAAHGDLAVIRALSRRERAGTAVFPVL